jgi:hypothetical protein
MRTLAFVVLLSVTNPGTGWSQAETTRPWGPRGSLLFAAKPPQGMRLVLGDTIPRPIQPTYWKEGAIAGGVVVGLLGAALGGGMCAYDETTRSCTVATLGAVLVGSATGVSLGALLGGQFHKPKVSQSRAAD